MNDRYLVMTRLLNRSFPLDPNPIAPTNEGNIHFYTCIQFLGLLHTFFQA